LRETERHRTTEGLRGNGGERERAFLVLVDRYHASLTRVASLWLEDAREIDALVQQTWVCMLRRLEPFDQQSSLKGWLCMTLIRLARARVGPAADPPVEPTSAEAANPAVEPERFSPEGNRWEGHWQTPPSDWPSMPEGNLVPRTVQCVIERAIAALPRSQRIVVILRDVERLSSHEVQSALGSTEEDQRVLLHHARSRIRAALERHHLAHAALVSTGEAGAAP
jgi:RNA polymerase sigma-70 factor (ECF subfamily)